MAAIDIMRRYMKIISVLKAHAYNITQLHDHLKDDFNCDRKTIERDVDILSGDGFITADDSSRPVIFYCNDDQRSNYLIRFKDEQLQILLLALESFKKESPEVIKNCILDIENNLSESLPVDLQRALTCFKDIGFSSYTIAGASAAQNDRDILVILQAVRERKRVHATYNQRARSLSPILIKVVAGEFYLYAKDHGDDAIKWFRVSRFINASLLDELAEINDDAGDESKVSGHHFGGFEGNNVIEYRITGNQRLGDYFYERKIADDQEVEELGPDRFLVTFTQNDSYELIRFLSSFGGNVTAIEPPTIKEQVRKVWIEGLDLLR